MRVKKAIMSDAPRMSIAMYLGNPDDDFVRLAEARGVRSARLPTPPTLDQGAFRYCEPSGPSANAHASDSP